MKANRRYKLPVPKRVSHRATKYSLGNRVNNIEISLYGNSSHSGEHVIMNVNIESVRPTRTDVCTMYVNYISVIKTLL